jgi:thiol-disulfide isomerase/thioredoxin
MTFVQGCDGAAKREVVEDFTLQQFSGESFTYSEHKGKVLIVNFFASWCIPCRAEAPALEAMYKEYLDKGVIVLGIAIKDTDHAAKGFVEKYALSFPTGLDKDEKIKTSFGVYGLPTTFFVDGNGLITYTHAGAVPEDLIKYELAKIL